MFGLELVKKRDGETRPDSGDTCTHTGSGREEGSVLASFCISACRDAAFKLPPEIEEMSVIHEKIVSTNRQLHPMYLVGCTEPSLSHEQC